MALSVFLNSSCFVHCWVPFACLALLGHSLTAWSRLCACLVVCLLFLHFCVCEIVSRGRRCHRDVDTFGSKTFQFGTYLFILCMESRFSFFADFWCYPELLAGGASSSGTSTSTSDELGLLCFAVFVCCLAWCLSLVDWLKAWRLGLGNAFLLGWW